MEVRRSPYLKHLYVCVNQREEGKACCAARDGEAIRERLKEYVNRNGLKGRVRVSGSGCMDLCEKGANVMVYPDYRWYRNVGPADVEEIIRTELAPLAQKEQILKPVPGTGRAVPAAADVPGTDLRIKAFFFDLGNVLVLFDHMASAMKIAAGAKMDPDSLFRFFFESPLMVEHDTGRISMPQFHRSLRDQLKLEVGYEEFVGIWNDIFTENEEMSALVRQVLGRWPCFVVSNTNRAHFEFIRDRFPLIGEFTGWVLSYEVGALKPDPAIYRRGLEMAGVEPHEVFYVDDRQDLIEAAHSMGFNVHRYMGTEPLVRELQSRGILSAAPPGRS
ncbi:MAG: HAD-IA family hydrolase [Candidatus Omnitrophica bacterium]|nr:HAD-IA family hydrolase [Candidatus Omnitrophota bacterium]